MAVKKVINLEVDTGNSEAEVRQLTGEIKKTEEQTNLVSEATESLTNSLDQMTGGAITGFKKMVTGAKAGVRAMGTLKVAIASTGIGLLVVAVGTLISYFTKTQRGADFVSKAFAGLKATVDVLIDRVSAFGEGLFMIMSGDFEAGAKKLAGSIKGIGDEIVNETKAAYELEGALQELEKREIALITVTAKREQQIKELRLEAQKNMNDQEKRGELLRQAMKLQDELYAEEVAIAKERSRIANEQLALGESTREDEREAAELQANVIRLMAERADRQRELQSELNGTITKEREINEVIRQRRNLEGLDSDLEDGEVQIAVEKETAIQEGTLAVIRKFAREREQISKVSAKAQVEIDRLKKEQLINLAGQTFGAIANIIGRNSKIGKAAGIAQALINTYTGITEVWRTESLLPEPAATIARIASTATVAASGFAAVKNIASVPIPSVGGGMSSSGGGAAGGRATTPPNPSFNIVGNSQANQLSEALNRDQQPVQAYVVSRDMTTQQELDRNIRNTASVG